MQEHQQYNPPAQGYLDLDDVTLDVDRPRRTGSAEAVFASGKTTSQVITALEGLRSAHPDLPALATRCSRQQLTAIEERFGDAVVVDGLAVVGGLPDPTVGTLGVVCAGTSDLPVAREAQYTARALGIETELITDVGVAGIHRLLRHSERIGRFDVLIAVAGMEGALPSVVAGLTSSPLIAVPTSIGYGASFDGLAPLLTMLNSCAPGITVVNIDNGFGAAQAALRMFHVSNGTSAEVDE
ncbi:nickel pincer cofactor biosynthesis protein LarB [Haloglycomyces albus]|uniref:nickel pincer cofactor biosynthesis protein LarB n=1 Tax=Haloglycomyces albus TaxID=526067 RepID=UPI00046D2E44|nr:nickel pincer cofactor biosynthesis protein LarB [Haloglycomyces albus]